MTNEELVAEIQQGINEKDNMQQLYMQNMPLISKLAKHYSAYAEYDDLMQEAYFGLKRAVDDFQFEQGTAFITIAYRYIRTVVSRYTVYNGSTKRIPIYMISLISKYKKYLTEYMEQHHSTPSDEEICKSLGISMQQLKGMRKAEYEMNCISIEAPVAGTDDITVGESIPSDEDIENDVTDNDFWEQVKCELSQAISKLDDRKQLIIQRRYYQDDLLQELADDLNISSERVRQLEKQALEKLQRNQKLKALADAEGYGSIAYKWGVGRFKNTNTSSTEYLAIKNVELEEKLRQEEVEYINLCLSMGYVPSKQYLMERRKQKRKVMASE